MARTVLMEEFHVTVLVPVGLSQMEYASIQRTLNTQRFRARLGKAIGALFRQHSSLKMAKVRISR